MNGKIELIVLPVEDVDRSKAFYVEQCGFDLHVDHAPSEQFRVVQCHPSGSACSIAFGIGMQENTPPGSVRGLHIVVDDIVAARDELIANSVDVKPIVHFTMDGTSGAGPHPERADYSSFASFEDPDGNGWLLQERGFVASDTKAA
jgi:catechol 2,3-dioxygenase-like lactoylglutathione lyase family enzyme